MRIHFATIRPEVMPSPSLTLERRLEMAGKNTGNLMFTNAVWRQIRFETATRTFSFDPQKVNEGSDALVIAAANWLNDYEDFGWLADQVEKLTVPTVIIGIGAQAQRDDDIPRIAEGTIRLIRAISARSHAVGVRGEFSKAVLEHHGITNVTVIGCPSLYGWEGSRDSAPVPPTGGRLVFGGTRYWPPRTQTPGRPHGVTRLMQAVGRRMRVPLSGRDRLQGRLYATALRSDAHLCLQSERPEIDLLDDATPDTSPLPATLMQLYEARDEATLRDYLRRRAKAYFNVDAWIEAMKAHDAYVGSRLHGVIASMLAGTPAVLLTHDRRTQEVADLAAIPQMSIEEFADVGVKGAIARLTPEALERYADRRRVLAGRYATFLRSNGLVPVADRDRPADDEVPGVRADAA